MTMNEFKIKEQTAENLVMLIKDGLGKLGLIRSPYAETSNVMVDNDQWEDRQVLTVWVWHKNSVIFRIDLDHDIFIIEKQNAENTDTPIEKVLEVSIKNNDDLILLPSVIRMVLQAHITTS